jgi:hypothetical protein
MIGMATTAAITAGMTIRTRRLSSRPGVAAGGKPGRVPLSTGMSSVVMGATVPKETPAVNDRSATVADSLPCWTDPRANDKEHPCPDC